MADLDPNLQQPARLRPMALLSAATEVEFATLRDHLGVSDSVLSKHLAALADVAYVSSRKGSHQGRRTTWIRHTSTGRKAMTAHSSALRAALDSIDP